MTVYLPREYRNSDKERQEVCSTGSIYFVHDNINRTQERRICIIGPDSEEEICGYENPQRDYHHDLEGHTLVDGGFF